MSFTINITKTICDINGKKLLKYPENTLLDAIINDLWNDIIRYLDYHPFAIGFQVETYTGYRAISQGEFNPFEFRKYYMKNKGVPNLVPRNLAFRGMHLGINYYYTSLNRKQAACKSTIDGKVKIYCNDRVLSWYSVLEIALDQKFDLAHDMTIFVPDI